MKYLLGAGDLLDGRMIFYDAMAMSFEEVEFRRNPECPVCGDDPIETLAQVEYADESCPVNAD